jgi:hypothetical protein
MPNSTVPASTEGVPNSDRCMALIDERWSHYRLVCSAKAEVDAQTALARMVDADSMIVEAKATTPEHRLAALNLLRHILDRQRRSWRPADLCLHGSGCRRPAVSAIRPLAGRANTARRCCGR